MKRFFKRGYKIIVSIFLSLSLVFVSSLSASAQAGYSYAFGGEFYLPKYGYNYEDIKMVADYAALMNYHSYYNGELTYSYVNSQRLNSDLTYFSCHGDQNGLYFPENGLTINRGNSNGSTIIGLSSWNLTNNKLMVFDACSTAAGTSNICTTAISRGADCVLGWYKDISTESINWLERFYNRLATGNTISAAVTYADSFNDYSSNSYLKNHRLYGNGNQKIKRTSLSSVSSVQLNDKEDERIHYITKTTFSYDNNDYSILENIIKKEFPMFDLNRYKIKVSSTSIDNKDFVVDFNEIVNGCWTSSGYTMIFTNETCDIIYDNTINSQNKLVEAKAFNVTEDAITISEAKQQAATYISSKDKIIEQKYEKCYDLQSNRYYYRIYTSFGPFGTTYHRTTVYDHFI